MVKKGLHGGDYSAIHKHGSGASRSRHSYFILAPHGRGVAEQKVNKMKHLTKLAGTALYNKTTREYLFLRGTGSWTNFCRTPNARTFLGAKASEKHIANAVEDVKKAGLEGFDPTPLYTTDEPFYRISVERNKESVAVMGYDCRDKPTVMNSYEADTLDLQPKLEMQAEYSCAPKGTDGYKMLMKAAVKMVNDYDGDAVIKIKQVRILEHGAPTE